MKISTWASGAVILALSMLLFACGSSESRQVSGMELTGMFRYMADAALFRDCRTDRTYPVAMEAQYIELERAYLNSGIGAGNEIFTRLNGRYLQRPAMEGNHNEVKLIVDSFDSFSPEKSCTPAPLVDLANTYWKLQSIEGRRITIPGTGQREAHFILKQEEGSLRIQGSSGCNRFFGDANHEPGDPGADKPPSLSFKAMGATMMACPQGMDTERAFLKALGSTRSYRIRGMFLELLDPQGTVLARFEAIHF